MQDRPTSAELLEAIAELLEAAVLPAVSGPLKHQVRVAGNLARILEREARLGPDHEECDAAALAAALGQEVDGRDTIALSAAVVERFDAGPDEAFGRRAFAAILGMVKRKLAIDKPGHDVFEFEGEVDP